MVQVCVFLAYKDGISSRNLRSSILYALLSYRDAVYRYGKRIQILFNTRYYSTLEGVVPLSARTRFPSLIDIGTEGDFSLTAAFQKAIDTAVAEADTYLQSLHAPQPGHYHRRN